jgi:hypothetical protein
MSRKSFVVGEKVHFPISDVLVFETRACSSLCLGDFCLGIGVAVDYVDFRTESGLW